MRWIKQTSSITNATHVVPYFLRELKVKVTKSSVTETLENHPDYPSVLSIKDSLQSWGIKSRCYQITGDKLSQIPVPFITYLSQKEDRFTTVTQVSEGFVTYIISETEKWTTVPTSEFLKNWNEIVLIVESAELKEEKDYEVKRKSEKIRALIIPFLFCSCTLLMLLFFFGSISNPDSILLKSFLILILFAGCIISSLLLFYEVDKSNPFIRQICSATGKSKCTAVLDSKGAKLFGWLSWSEIGFFYFTGSFLFLLITGTDVFGMLLLAMLNAAAVPYCFYSVFYQWKVVKQWCVLCLCIQALLILQFAISYFLVWTHINLTALVPSLHQALLFFTSFLLPVMFWTFSKHHFVQAKLGSRFNSELNRLKYDNTFFETLLQQQKQVAGNPFSIGIMLGNPNASNSIITACSPYCDPCARAHPIIEDLLNRNRDLCVCIIFNATNKDGDARNEPVKHLLALFHNSETVFFLHALNDWYSSQGKDYPAFAKKYPFPGRLSDYDAEVNRMNTWCEHNSIEFTPTIFINGYQLPAMYTPNDLPVFLSGE